MTQLTIPVIPHTTVSDVVYFLTMKILETVLMKTTYSAYAAEKTRRELRDYDRPICIIFVVVIALNY